MEELVLVGQRTRFFQWAIESLLIVFVGTGAGGRVQVRINPLSCPCGLICAQIQLGMHRAPFRCIGLKGHQQDKPRMSVWS